MLSGSSSAFPQPYPSHLQNYNFSGRAEELCRLNAPSLRGSGSGKDDYCSAQENDMGADLKSKIDWWASLFRVQSKALKALRLELAHS